MSTEKTTIKDVSAPYWPMNIQSIVDDSISQWKEDIRYTQQGDGNLSSPVLTFILEKKYAEYYLLSDAYLELQMTATSTSNDNMSSTNWAHFMYPLMAFDNAKIYFDNALAEQKNNSMGVAAYMKSLKEFSPDYLKIASIEGFFYDEGNDATYTNASVSWAPRNAIHYMNGKTANISVSIPLKRLFGCLNQRVAINGQEVKIELTRETDIKKLCAFGGSVTSANTDFKLNSLRLRVPQVSPSALTLAGIKDLKGTVTDIVYQDYTTYNLPQTAVNETQWDILNDAVNVVGVLVGIRPATGENQLTKFLLKELSFAQLSINSKPLVPAIPYYPNEAQKVYSIMYSDLFKNDVLHHQQDPKDGILIPLQEYVGHALHYYDCKHLDGNAMNRFTKTSIRLHLKYSSPMTGTIFAVLITEKQIKMASDGETNIFTIPVAIQQ